MTNRQEKFVSELQDLLKKHGAEIWSDPEIGLIFEIHDELDMEIGSWITGYEFCDKRL